MPGPAATAHAVRAPGRVPGQITLRFFAQ